MPHDIDPFTGLNFMVDLGGIGGEDSLAGGFKDVEGLEVSIDQLEYRVGNEKSSSVRKLPGMRRFSNVTLRRGFLTRSEGVIPRRLDLKEISAGGVGIGAIATFLGVGGSVMTVPLLRRCGLSMSQATSMANPLSVPVAVAGTLTYMELAGFSETDLGAWFVGYVDLLAFAVLTLGALVGIRLATPWKIGRAHV